MSVLHVITGLDLGGAESVLVRTVLFSRSPDGPRQIVVSLMDEGVHGAALRSAGVELHCLGMRRGLPSPGALLRLARLMRRERPDVIMSWLYHADLAATLAALIGGVGTERLVWNLRCADMDFTRYSPGTRWTVGALSRLSHLPAAVAANSRAGRMHHERLGYRPRRWVELPNGFDLDAWRPDAHDRAAVRAELGLDDHAIAIGMVARVDPMKDHATFLAAAERVARDHANARFVLIGKGTEALPLAPALKGRLLALGERRAVPRLLRGLDMAVLSSISEGFPNVVGEAMATGVPCVVTDVGDAARIVGETGEVVPPRSPEALAQAIARITCEPEEARRRRGEAARQRIAESYSLTRSMARYRELWDEVARRSPRADVAAARRAL